MTTLFDNVMKQHWIMGLVFPYHAHGLSFIRVMQEKAMDNCDPLQMINTNCGKKATSHLPVASFSLLY